jgi:hypothetical protein
MRNPIIVLSFSLLSFACSDTEAPSKTAKFSPAVGNYPVAKGAALPESETADSPDTTAISIQEDFQVVAEESHPAPEYYIQVRSGENLVGLSNWAHTTPTQLAEINGMDVQDMLIAGQTLGFSLSGAAIDEFESAREDVLEERLDRYLESRGGLFTVEGHAMRSGETVWGLAKANGGLPMWVVGAFNSDMNLDRLAIGDTVTLPVLSDSVQVSLEPEVGEEADVPTPGGSPF